MDLKQRKVELETQITEVEKEIEVKAVELEEVRKQLDKDPLAAMYEEELDDNDFVSDDAEDKEDEKDEYDDDEDEKDKDEKDGKSDTGDEGDDAGKDKSLLEEETRLADELLVLQMRLIALNKQLNDVLAQQGLDLYVEKEEE